MSVNADAPPRVFDVFVFPPSVHPQRLGSQKRPCDGGQRYEDRRLRSRQRRAQYRLLQKDHEREFESRVHQESVQGNVFDFLKCGANGV